MPDLTRVLAGPFCAHPIEMTSRQGPEEAKKAVKAAAEFPQLLLGKIE